MCISMYIYSASKKINTVFLTSCICITILLFMFQGCKGWMFIHDHWTWSILTYLSEFHLLMHSLFTYIIEGHCFGLKYAYSKRAPTLNSIFLTKGRKCWGFASPISIFMTETKSRSTLKDYATPCGSEVRTLFSPY